MPTEPDTTIIRLLQETESAHGGYETNTLGGQRDDDWPAWYATYLLDHGLGALLPHLASDDVSQLAATLALLDEEYRRGQQARPWPEFYAARLVRR
jgi:hypothetical protein